MHEMHDKPRCSLQLELNDSWVCERLHLHHTIRACLCCQKLQWCDGPCKRYRRVQDFTSNCLPSWCTVCGTNLDEINPRELASFAQNTNATASSQFIERPHDVHPDGETAVRKLFNRQKIFRQFHEANTERKRKW